MLVSLLEVEERPTNKSYDSLVVVVPHIVAIGGRGTTNKSYNSLVVMVPCIVVIVIIPGVGSGGHQPCSYSVHII